MTLGTRLRQTRLEAGLTQRQLCGDTITRNMLSQIENGTARPSMDTLRVLAARLGKPMGYFLEEQAVTSPNQQLITQARQAPPQQVLELLKDYVAPDPVFDRERWLLEALACIELAQQLSDQKPGYAAALLEQAAAAGAATPYYTPELERRRVLLCYDLGGDAADLAARLPDNTGEQCLRAQACLDRGEPAQAAIYLDAAPQRDDRWHLLRAESWFARKQYTQALAHYRQCIPTDQIYSRMEHCCRELEDYKMAYFYACQQRPDPPADS